MRKNLNRVLACLLSVALLVTCAISGLVLPVSADAPVNLLEGKVQESYTFPAGTKDKEVMRGVTLEASTDYVFRFVASGAAGKLTFVYNGGWNHVQTVESTAERVYQIAFSTSTTNLDKTYVYAYNTTASDFNVRNIELYKAAADGEFNVTPGGDFSMETTAFNSFYAKGATIVADPDNADNSVLSVPAGSGAVAYNNYAGKHMLIKLSFRYKGYFRFEDYMGSGGCIVQVNGGKTEGTSGDTYAGKATPLHAIFNSQNAWAEGSVIVKRASSQDSYFYWRNLGGTLYLDDVKTVKIASPIELVMNKATLDIYPGNFDQLSYTTVPSLAYIPDGSVVWTSSNPSVISVDQTGKVTAAANAEFGATATITAKYSDTVKDTCEVTVSDGAPKPPAYTEAGKNPFASVDTNVNIVGGGEAVQVQANALLKANTRYWVGFKAKSSVAGATVTSNATTDGRVVSIPQSEGWLANAYSFKTGDGGMNFTLTFNAPADTTATLNVKDIELYEIDASLNLVPGSSFSTGTEAVDTIFFVNHTTNGSTIKGTVVDDPDEIGNKMFHVTGGGYYGFKEVLGYSGFPAKAVKFTFRYKGGAVQMDNWGTDVHYIDFPEGTSILARKANDTQIRCIQLASTSTWKTVSVIAAVKDYSQATYLQLKPAYGSSFYIDDFQMFEMPLSTELILDKTSLNLYPTDSDILNVTGGPAGTFLDIKKVTWKSSDENVATVDSAGNVKAVGTTDGATAVITAMLDGVEKATCLVTIDYDAPKPPMPTEPGVNAMESVADVTVDKGVTTSVKAGAILKAKTRYALRFVSKSAGTVNITTNGGSAAKAVPATANWRANQILFTTGDAQVDNFMITIAVADADGAKIEIKDWELYEAPADGSFNLIPGSSADYETAFLNNHFNRGVEVKDDGTGNSAYYFSKTLKDGANYLGIGDIGGYQVGKVWKITFRMKGLVRFEDWGSGSERPEQPDAFLVSGNKQYTYFKADDWTTFSYYIKMKDGSQAPYVSFVNRDQWGSYHEAWIDDIQLYEMDASESIEIVEQGLKLYPTSTQQLTYKWGPEGSVLMGNKMQWTSSDEGVALVNKDTGFVTLVGDHGDTVTITADNGKHQATTVITVDETADHAEPATGLTITAACGGDLDVGQTIQLVVLATPAENLVGRLTWESSDPTVASVTQKGVVTALSEGEVDIKVTSEFGTSASIKLATWEHPNLIINGDMEQGGSVSWRDKNNVLPGVGMYGSYGWYMDDANTGCYYNQNLVLKPATTYQLSFRYKAEKGVSARIYAAAIGGGNLYASKYCEPGTLETAEWQFASKTFTTADFWDAEATWAISVNLDPEATIDGSRMIYDNVALREFVTGEPVTSVEINQQNVSLAPGRNVKLTVTTEPLVGDVNDLVWSSSNEQVAYVVAGNVFGVGAGTATISVKTKSGAVGTCEVTVNGAPALLNNGTFETQDDPATTDVVEGSWVLSEKDAAYFEGGGINASYGMQMYKGGVISQTFKGLKADTAYQVMLRSRQRSAATVYDIVITDKNGREVAKMQGGGSAQRSVTYKSAFAKYDFITPADLVPDEEYTFTLSYRPDAGEVLYLDHLMIVEAASDVDLVVSDITWTPDNADQVEPGTKVGFVVSIVNQGLEAYGGAKGIDVDIMVDAKKILTISRPASALAIGTLIPVEVPVGQEWIATEGDHTITAHVNSTMTVLENNPDNNYASVNLRVAKKEDFAVAPAGAIEKGYNRLVFSDDFSSLDTFDTLASGNHGYKWYVTRPWGEPNVSAGRDFSIVEDSYLKLHTVQTAWNYSICTVDAKKPGVGYSFNMGYIEFRVRMKETAEGGKVNGIRVPAIWAFSDETIWGTRPKGKGSLELDWIEYWGDKYGKPRFDTTLHDTRLDENDNQISKVSSGEKHYEPIGDYNWHVYGMGWSKGSLKTYFDGELIATLKYSEDGWPEPMPSGVINVGGDDDPYEGLWSILDKQNMPVILGGASDFPLEIDWIRVWQSDGSIDPVPEQDEAVTDFIKDYGTFGGSLITEPTVKNYQTIMNGEAAYNALTAAQQAEVDATLGVTYLDLVAQVYDGISVAENFIAYYACAEDGTPYMAVDDTNYGWIASAQTEWDMMSDFARALVNMAVSANSGMSFQELLDAALAYVPTYTEEPPAEEPQLPVQQSANLTWLWIALGVVGVLLVAGGVVIALLLFSKKRKAAK